MQTGVAAGLILRYLTFLLITVQFLAPNGSGAQNSPQVPETPLAQLTYDTSTFKPSTVDSGNRSVWTHFNTLTATNWPVADMLQEAFRIQPQLIVDLPSWTQKARYDVNAKVTGADMAQLQKLTPEQWNAMLRGLLEERLGLRWHFETRPELVYELVPAKGGPKLRVAAGPGADAGISVGDSNVTATSVPISALTKLLSRKLERPVVDQTKLMGLYDSI